MLCRPLSRVTRFDIIIYYLNLIYLSYKQVVTTKADLADPKWGRLTYYYDIKEYVILYLRGRVSIYILTQTLGKIFSYSPLSREYEDTLPQVWVRIYIFTLPVR